MKAVIFGATGLIGSNVAARLRDGGSSVISVSRNKPSAESKIPGLAEYRELRLDKEQLSAIMDGSDAVINFSGASVFSRHHDYDAEVRDSRISVTRAISESMAACGRKPSVFINGSATGYYGKTEASQELTEDSLPGKDFWGKLVEEWEAAAVPAMEAGVRTVFLRTSVVLSHEGGALSQLIPVFKVHLGGYIKPGDQNFAWVHMEDEVGLVEHAIGNTQVSGPMNAASPGYVTSAKFSRALGDAMGRKSGLGIPEFILRARVGKAFDLLASGGKIIPKKALDTGYRFRFTDINAAMNEIIGKLK